MFVAIAAIVFVFMCNKYFQTLKASLASRGSKLLFRGGSLKQVYIVRCDLGMGKGKLAAQCCHAAVKAFRELSTQGTEAMKMVNGWERQGSRKIVVKANTEEELMEIIAKAKQKGLYASTIRDAGKTQIPAGSTTVGVIGPGNEEDVDEVSGHLKLL